MNINTDQLEINVNLHALHADFLNSELHHIIAKSETSFRFAAWHDEPVTEEEKFYCFLTDHELLIPAGNILLKESYLLKKEAIYPAASTSADFVEVIEKLAEEKVIKCIRKFYDEDIDIIKKGLEEKYGAVQKHVVTSRQGQHLLFLLEDIEISVSATMIYFRYKTSFNASHYKHVLEDKNEEN